MTPTSFVGQYKIEGRKVFIRIKDQICDTPEELISSALFSDILRHAVQKLSKRNSIIMQVFGKDTIEEADLERFINALKYLSKMEGEVVPKVVDGSDVFFKNKNLLNDFVEYLYNYWRSFDRFIICDSEGSKLDKRPFRTFNFTIENLTRLVRQTYRDIQENIMGTHPSIYRQISAGAEGAVIALPKKLPLLKGPNEKLKSIPVIRQILIYPPLVLNPPMNKRKGKFERIEENPINWMDFSPTEWICYPVKASSDLILVYIHEKFFELGISLCNLFDVANDEDLKKKPTAVYFFGMPEKLFEHLTINPTVFYDDEKNQMLVGAVPDADDFGYFGYLKKMILTLHNIKKIKEGKMPFHGALVRIYLKDAAPSTLLLMGESGAGKSETLEALREIGEGDIQDLITIADDMGSLEISKDGKILGYGTEIGAFLRLDDLNPGYAFGQIDRAIIMNAHQINARIVLPVTTTAHMTHGYPVDFVLYANNYEDIDDEDHPLIESFKTWQDAIRVFRDGKVMSKGTTTSTGLVNIYFANIFGPVQYKCLHEKVAEKFFQSFFRAKIYVGQMRTRLGLQGWERQGPEEAAKDLIRLIREKKTRP